MPADIQAWRQAFLHGLLATLPGRVCFAGLQGSYRRGEADGESDIDPVEEERPLFALCGGRGPAENAGTLYPPAPGLVRRAALNADEKTPATQGLRGF